MVENKISTTIAVEGTMGILASAREKVNIDPKILIRAVCLKNVWSVVTPCQKMGQKQSESTM